VAQQSERSYSFLERLLFYTLPVLFALLLSGVLLTVFGYDIMNGLLRAGDKIPGVSSLLPDPKPTEEELRDAIRQASNPAEGGRPIEEQSAALQAALSVKEAEVAALQAEQMEKDRRIAELQSELAAAQTASEQAALTEEQYMANIRHLAAVYASMKPSKAAPVIEGLTLQERVLVLKEMKKDQQVNILEKMDPKIAAETSILMKDIVPAEDLQIAALQERLALSAAEAPVSAKLTKDEVSRTFSQMAPERAADVLLAMSKADEAKVVSILRFMEESSRAALLDALAKLDKERTAKLSAKLG
jgi:flagellar motility protein MotE (MotC chaperone)